MGEVKTELAGSVTGAIGGAAAVVLAILGLVHLAPGLLASIATIVVGVAFLAQGSSFAVRANHEEAALGPYAGRLGGEWAMESMCGAAGVVLGILALVGTARGVLIPASMIVFGAGLLTAGGASAQMPVTTHRAGSEPTAGSEALIGFAGIVLGILALAGYTPMVLSLVSLLVFGFGILLSETWVTARMMALFSW